MAELKRKDETLTTADLAGRSEKPPEPEAGPQLVRDGEAGQSEPSVASASPLVDDVTQKRNPSSTAVGDTGAPIGMKSPAGSAWTNADAQNQPAALFSESEVGDFRSRWSNIQTAFVDEPRKVVEDADNLVASLMKKLAEGFANKRERLEKQWDRGDNVSTEDLRIALQRYRSFFDRLLKV